LEDADSLRDIHSVVVSPFMDKMFSMACSQLGTFGGRRKHLPKLRRLRSQLYVLRRALFDSPPPYRAGKPYHPLLVNIRNAIGAHVSENTWRDVVRSEIQVRRRVERKTMKDSIPLRDLFAKSPVTRCPRHDGQETFGESECHHRPS